MYYRTRHLDWKTKKDRSSKNLSSMWKNRL